MVATDTNLSYHYMRIAEYGERRATDGNRGLQNGSQNLDTLPVTQEWKSLPRASKGHRVLQKGKG